VQVPGATLPAGSYVFEMVDPTSTQHVVKITSEDGTKVYTVTHAVPMKRRDATGDMVIMFNPPAAGGAPALKGWYAPGSLTGHELMYSEEEAREIAQRTKTLVLSRDVPDSSKQGGVIVVYDAEGVRSSWQQDPATQQEWDQWLQKRQSTDPDERREQAREARESTVPMVSAQAQGRRVTIEEIEDNPQQYIGQTVSVDGEVEEVLGPHLFRIDEPKWSSPGEMLVFMPPQLVALVREDDRVTVTGTLRAFARADIDRETDWLQFDKDIEVSLSRKPVLIATRVVGGNNNTAIVLDVRPTAAATDAEAPADAVTDPAALGRGTDDLVGRHVDIGSVVVGSAVADPGGFFIRSGDQHVFVLTAKKGATDLKSGDTVSLQGVVLSMPRDLERKLTMPDNANDTIYVYATQVRKSGGR
jgi:hypothetical protein